MKIEDERDQIHKLRKLLGEISESSKLKAKVGEYFKVDYQPLNKKEFEKLRNCDCSSESSAFSKSSRDCHHKNQDEKQFESIKKLGIRGSITPRIVTPLKLDP